MDALTDDQIRIKCAEAMGWRCISSHTVGRSGKQRDVIKGKEPRSCMQKELPAYAADLNACAEFRASLTEEERTNYVFALSDIATQPGDMGWGVANATARQHCLAFLTVKGRSE